MLRGWTVSLLSAYRIYLKQHEALCRLVIEHGYLLLAVRRVSNVGEHMRERLLKASFRQSAGASLVEYSLLVALIASTCLASTQMLGFQISRQLSQVFDGGTSQGGDSN